MITLFNRREVLLTYSLQAQSDARNALQAAGIDYIVRTKNTMNHHGAARAHTGSFAQRMDAAYEYKIYVHKADYAKARMAIGAM